MPDTPDMTEIVALAVNRAIRQAQREDPDKYRTWWIKDFATCAAHAAIEAHNKALAEAGFVGVRASRVDLGGSIIGSVPPHAEEVMWTGDNVEEITRLTGCSAEDVRKYIPPGSRVWRAGGGWNLRQGGGC